MKTTAIIFSEASDNNLYALTQNRTVASLAFGGRYRLIDFVLSAIVNAGISNVAILTERNYRSLMDHLGSCREWDLDRKNAGLKIISPYASSETNACRGKIDQLSSALEFLETYPSDVVILADPASVCNIDIKDVLASHRASGADVTIMADRCAHEKKDTYKLVMDVDEKSRPKAMFVDYVPHEGQYESISAYVISRTLLIEKVRTLAAQGLYHFEKDFLQRSFNQNEVSFNVYCFDGIVLRNNTIEHYLKNNLLLNQPTIRESIFRPENPIFTRERDETPTYFGPECEAIDCAVADGSHLFGKIENSVIGREVLVEKGATVKNSLIMQGCVIQAGAYIENAIIDKNVTVTGDVRLIGTPAIPVIVQKGSKV